MQLGRIDLRLGVSMLAATSRHVADCPDLGPECAGPLKPTPFNHQVDLVTSDVSLDVAYGVTEWLAFEARLALRLVDLTPTYTELDRRPKSVPDDPHHHDVTLAGPTDPWLVLRFASAFGDLRTAARVGVTLPIGGTEPNPYELGARGEYHEHTQLGTGTFVPIVGAGVSYTLDPVELDLSALGFFSLYENREGFRAPSRMFLSLRATVPLLDGALRPYVALDLARQAGERWDGAPGLEGDDERTELLLGGGLAWTFADPWQAQIGVRGRLAKLTDAAGFDYPGILDLGLSTHFDVGPKRRDAGKGGAAKRGAR